MTLGEEQVLQTAGARRWVGSEAYHPSYNASPGSALPVVRLSTAPDDQAAPEVVVHTMR